MVTVCGDFGGLTTKGKKCRRSAIDGGKCAIHRGVVSAGTDSTCRRPRSWEQAKLAAFWCLVAPTLEKAAELAGIGDRTLRRWRSSPWWYDAVAEAEEQWLKQAKMESRRTLIRAIVKGDSLRAWELLKRVDPKLMPPAQRVDHYDNFIPLDVVEDLVVGLAEDIARIVKGADERAALKAAGLERMKLLKPRPGGELP